MTKKSEKLIQDAVDKLLEEIAILQDEAKQEGLVFTCLDKEDLLKKESSETSESPYAYFFAWSTPRNRGWSGLYRMYIRNPDPISHFWLFVTIYFGLGNIFADISQGWVGRDTRWPTLTTSQFSLAPDASTHRTLSFTVPSNIPPSTYLGNAIFWKQLSPQGLIYYRGGFHVTVNG